MMTNKERYKQAFSTLHASRQISLEGCKMQKKEKSFSLNRFAVVMGALLICCSVFYWSQSVYAYTDAAAKVFLEKDIDQTKMDAIQAEIEKLDGVKDVEYVSAEQAWEDFQNKYFSGEDAKGLAESFTENPLEDSQNFAMKVLKDADLEKLQKEMEQIDGVRLVSLDKVEE